MTIKGIGTDLCEISRIEQVVGKFPQKFPARILHSTELARYHQHPCPLGYLAKRFAAKEAISKALGLGIGRVAFADIEVGNNQQGAPVVTLSGEAAAVLKERGGQTVHLSLSDERRYAIAFAVIE